MNRVFTVFILSVAALASAKPAYNYQSPAATPVAGFSQQQPGLYQAPQPVTNSGIYSAVLSTPINLPPPQQFVQQIAAPAPQFIAPVQQQQFASPVNQPQRQQQQVIISKDIYIHSGPEEVEEIGNDAGSQGPLRKNYRIVFIKSPSQSIKLNVDALKRNQASNEEKTVIYVLSKKPDLANLQSQLANVQNEQKAHKPEVYFIKYKTQEEANRAQQEIQAQYDSLGGSTSVSDEGFAPVTSVVGGGSVRVGSNGAGFGTTSFKGANTYGQQQISQQSYQTSVGSSQPTVDLAVAPSQTYLPAKKK